MFTNVIAGVDGYDGGRDAVMLAKALCTGQLTLVHAFPGATVSSSRALLAGYRELQQEDSRRTLEAARLGADVEADLVPLADISPARALQRIAEERDADLIVVGSAHHGTVGRILLGDVGRVVVHGAPCPVAVAPKRFQGETPRTIAVGFDGSAESRAALELAKALAKGYGAELTLYVAWAEPPTPVVVAAGSVAYLETVAEEQRRSAEELLEETLRDLPATTTGHALHGSASAELVKVAERHDLFVVGSRSWGPLKRVALGSTSDWLVHHAPCPVVVAPRPAELTQEQPLTSAGAAVSD